jgi:hypothetical protein
VGQDTLKDPNLFPCQNIVSKVQQIDKQGQTMTVFQAFRPGSQEMIKRLIPFVSHKTSSSQHCILMSPSLAFRMSHCFRGEKARGKGGDTKVLRKARFIL